MKFNAKHDIEAPVSYVFTTLTNFDLWVHAAVQRGAEITRTDKMALPGAGMTWHVRFPFRQRMRAVNVRLATVIPNNRLELITQSQAFNTSLTIYVVEMSAKTTRLHMVSDINPRTLAAKLFTQSLRLARARADRKYTTQIVRMAQHIEERYRAEQTKI